MPAWVEAGYTEYAKRLSGDWRLQLIEIEASKRTKNSAIDKILMEEGYRLLAAIPKNARIVALDIQGKAWSTLTLAEHLKTWQMDGRPVSFLIGGPEGLAEQCLARADYRWSLSPLTFPHPLVRILIAEQLYRAKSLLCRHPYHRD